VAALLSVVLLAGVLLPVLRHACTDADAPSAASATEAHAVAAPHTASDHAGSDATASSHNQHPAPADGSAHECDNPCAIGACCVLPSLLSEAPDLYRVDRTVQPADVLPRLTVEDRTRPWPDRTSWRPRSADSFSPPPSVRLHVWTATFLT
jgi:hypothetical protein